MRLVVIFLLLSFGLNAQKYVATSGSGTTCSIGSPCSLTYAFANAVAGETWYVKAGDYGALQLSTSNAGTVGNTIKFIGYTTTPGDIVATNGSTYTITNYISDSEVLPTTLMPLLKSTNLNPASTVKAIQINHNYIEIHNFLTQGYWESTVINADNITLNNVGIYKAGAWDPTSNCWQQPDSFSCDNRYGYGLRVTSTSDNMVLRHMNVVDAGIDAYFILGGNNHLVEYSEAHTYNKGNGTDYLFNFNGAVTNSTVQYCSAKRWYTGGHESRVLVVKCSATGNVIKNFNGENARLQVFYADNNEFRDIYLKGDGSTNTAEIQIFGEADGNLFINVEIEDGTGISFLGYNVGAGSTECGIPGSADLDSGSNNYFINLLVHDVSNLSGMAAVSFHRLGWGPNGNAGVNYVVNSTFHDVPYLINANRAGTVHFYNTSFSTIYQGKDTFYVGFPDLRGSYTATYTNTNFFNLTGFSTPTGTSITTVNPLYTSAGTDYSLQSGSGLRDIGMNASTLNASASTDFLGNSRSVPYDIGAYEFGGAPPVDLGILGGKSKRSFFKLIN